MKNLVIYVAVIFSGLCYSCSNEEYVDPNASGKNNGHEYVDLGLSVKWATCNVGASAPEQYGNYFAWGETMEKNKYSKESSIWWRVNIKNLGLIDECANLTPQYDAATQNWGGKWRMPTLLEIEELVYYCTWEWTTLNGVYGYKVISKKKGYEANSIFLPAAGSQDCYEYKDTPMKSGAYWSSTDYDVLEHDEEDRWELYGAGVLLFSDYSVGTSGDNRRCYLGLSIRPVIK